MKNKDEIKSLLIKAISEKTGFPEESINSGMSLEKDLGMDSIAKVEILSKVSEQYGIDWEDMDEAQTDKLGSIQTINELISFIETIVQ